MGTLEKVRLSLAVPAEEDVDARMEVVESLVLIGLEPLQRDHPHC